MHAIGYVALPFTGEAAPPAAPTAAQAAAQAIAAAAATAATTASPLPVLTEVAQAAADASPNPSEGSRLRERALARAREQAADPDAFHAAQAAETAAAVLATLAPATLKRSFNENFIDTLNARQVARFALKHGRVLARAPLDGPVRQVPAEPGRPDRRQRVPAQVYLLTAVIETDTRKSRVLLGQGPLVLGRRIHSGPRMAALGAFGAGLVGTAVWWMQPRTVLPETAAGSGAIPAAEAHAPPAAASEAVAQAPAGDARPASQPASATLPSADSAHPAQAAPPPEVTPAPMPAHEPASMRAREPPETRRRGVSIVPLLSEEQKALAREQRQALLEAAAAAVPVPTTAADSARAASAPAVAGLPKPAPSPAITPAPAPVAPPVMAAPPSGPVFAISTRALRTRAEADQVRVAMQSLLQSLGHARMQVDVLPQGDDWRVVALPFPQRADAEKGRALLASRGMRVAVVDF